jgi:hypothetical protein
MPRPPLFESSWARQSAVTAALGAVFVAAMLLAGLTTMRSTVELPGATVGVPGTWQRLTTEAQNQQGVEMYALSAEGQQRFIATAFQFEQRVPPAAARARFQQLQAALAQRGEVTFDSPASWEATELDRDRFVGARYFGTTRFVYRGARFQRLHFVSVLTPDSGRTYWALYFTDVTPYGRETNEIIAGDRALMQEIEQSLNLTDS